MRNTPDDWDSYWVSCAACGRRYHLSEYCDCDVGDDQPEVEGDAPVDDQETVKWLNVRDL